MLMMYTVSDKVYTALFANDTNVFIDRNDFKQLIQELNSELQKLYIWLN